VTERNPGGDGPGHLRASSDLVVGCGEGIGDLFVPAVATPGQCGAALSRLASGHIFLGFSHRSGGGLLGRVGHAAFKVVGHLRVGVEDVDAQAVAQVAEEVLLTPAGEHGVGDCFGRQVGAGREDLDLVTGCGIELCHLAATEAPEPTAVLVGEADPALGQPVDLGPPEVVGELVAEEGRAGLRSQRCLAVDEEAKAVPFQLSEELEASAAPVEDDRGPCVVADEGPDLLHGGAQITRRICPGGVLHTSTPSPRASVIQVSTSAGALRRDWARCSLGIRAPPW